MKTVLTTALVVLTAGFTIPAVAATHDHGDHAAMQAQAPAEAQMVEGLVKKVDKSAEKVTLSHGPLVNLGMPAMTMVFRVKDANWLDQMKDGDKIRFMADKVNGAITVVHFEKSK